MANSHLVTVCGIGLIIIGLLLFALYHADPSPRVREGIGGQYDTH